MTARLLVADDHPIVRAGVAALLAAEDDLEVVAEAANGEEAVAETIRLAPDLVLMDLRMPVLDGAEAAKRIRAAAPATRILMLTTFESDEALLAAVEAGARGYLLKAAPGRELVAAVRAVLRGEAVLSPAIAASLVERASRPRPTLTPREREVLALVAAGCSNPQIATRLTIAEATVKTHLLRLFAKLEVDDRTRAVTRAMELGLL